MAHEGRVFQWIYQTVPAETSPPTRAAPADSEASVIGPTAGGRRQLLSSKDVHICVSNSKAVKIVFVPAQVSSYLREFGQRSALLCYR